MDNYGHSLELRVASHESNTPATRDSRLATVVLVGFMGCGKSSVARALAARLRCNAVDLDDLIVERAGTSIAEIFAQRGEAEFRRIETEVLRDALGGTSTARVIATGGGIVTRPENRELLKEAANHGVLVVYLQTQSETLARRIRRQPGLRPLIDGERVLSLEETQRRVSELLEIRTPWYREVAGMIINTDQTYPAEIARQIETRLRTTPNDSSTINH